MIVHCSTCNKPLERFPVIIARNKTGLWFCDKQCKDAYYTHQNTHTCIVCGNSFVSKPYRSKRLNKSGGLTCSKECRVIALGWGHQELTCEWCGRSFNRRNAQVNSHNFCSRECMGKWQSENKVGENSPSWQGGYIEYYGANWEQQRKKAYKRDDKTCQACGKPEKDCRRALEVHHKKPFRLCTDYHEANALTNLITLCESCHRLSDTFARWFFNLDRRQTEPTHPLQNHTTILRVYFDHKAAPP